MATDATTQLIQRVISQLPSSGVTAPNSNANAFSLMESVAGTVANYAQVFGTAAAPIAQGIAIAIAGGSTAATLDAAGQAALLAAGATTAGVGAGIVLLLSVVLASLGGSSGSDSAETELLYQLNEELNFINAVNLANYWAGKIQGMRDFWNSPTGGLGIDFNDLAAYGIVGNYVKTDASQYHDNAIAFLDNLTNTGAQQFWERPFDPTQLVTPQQVPYPTPILPNPSYYVGPELIGMGSIMGWYGNLPQPPPGPPLGGQSLQMVLDPRSMLPYLLLGIHSYLTLATVVSFIDASQTFSGFVKELPNYVNETPPDGFYSVYSQYKLAVNGIVKTDTPSNADVMSFINFTYQIVATPITYTKLGGNVTLESGPLWSWSPGSDPYQGGTGPAYTGYAWNGVYGAIDVYPQYGAYEPSPSVAIPASLPWCLIDVINTDNLVIAFEQLAPYGYLEQATLVDWILPWVEDKLILGRMARWKAIYLMNGYDQVWSILQKTYAVANPDQPPLFPVTLAQDGTMANGNWSARELINVLNLSGDITDFVPEGSLPIEGAAPGPVPTYSLFSLVQVLDTIATGDWIGTGGVISGTPLQGLSRPAGFRERLAAAAV